MSVFGVQVIRSLVTTPVAVTVTGTAHELAAIVVVPSVAVPLHVLTIVEVPVPLSRQTCVFEVESR